MKLSLSIITLAAMCAVAAASPMVDVGRYFATDARAAAPGAGSSVSGAHDIAPPANLMASAPRGEKVAYGPSQAGRLRDGIYSEPKTYQRPPAEEITDTLLYLSRPLGTTYTYTTPIDSRKLHNVAKLLAASHQDDHTAQTLGEQLKIIANGLGEQRDISIETKQDFHQALREYLKAHPNLNAMYNAKTVNRISEQEALTGNAIGSLQSHVHQMDFQVHGLGEVLNAIYQTLPKETQEAIRGNIEQGRRHEAYLKKQELLHANNPKAFPDGRPQSSSQSPSGPAKETSHESLFTQPGANTGASDFKSPSTGTRENFRSSGQESVTGDNAQHPVQSQSSNRYGDGVHGAASPSNNHGDDYDEEDYADEPEEEDFYDFQNGKNHQVPTTREPPTAENFHTTQPKRNPILIPNDRKVLSPPADPAAAKAAAAA